MADLLTEDESMDKETEVLFHQSIKKVTEDFETLKFNTAIAQLMTLSNALRAKERVTRTEWKTFLLLLNPVAPHVTEELWERAGFTGHIATDGTWPEYQDDKLSENYAEMPIQISGKVRGKVVLPLKATQEQAVEAAQKEESIARYLEGKKLAKVIFVPNKILNLVVK